MKNYPIALIQQLPKVAADGFTAMASKITPKNQ
jgi:hypothetical protein